jgi:hypothetical protein
LNIPAIPARLTKPKEDKPTDNNNNNDNNKPEEDPVLKQLCGCSPDISVTNPSGSSWLDLVTANYPDVQPAVFAANILAMCNRAAKFVASPSDSKVKLVAPGQSLRGICTTLKGKSYQQFLNDAHMQAEAVKAEIAAGNEANSAAATTPAPAAPDAAATATAELVSDEGVDVAQAAGYCAISTGTSTAPVRPVYLANACPVYTNG